jgi:hypothetical protein
MRYLALIFSAMFVFAVACDDDKDQKTDCEVLASVATQAAESVCDGSVSCTFCECFAQGMEMEVTGDGTDVAYACVEASGTCDATEAAGCADDEDVCLSLFTSAADSACTASASPMQ